MNIALFGATGAIGQRILNEALTRGHHVTAIVRDPARLTQSHPNLTVVQGDVTDPAQVASTIQGADAVIGSISGRRTGTAETIVDAARSLLEGAAKAGVYRVLWVGGAGSLEVAPGVRLIDTPEFPAIYLPEAKAGVAVLDLFRAAAPEFEWTYVSPAAVIAPGERTGNFRVGGDQLMTDANGESRISQDDYAAALIDEVENRRHVRQRMSVAY